LTGKKPRCTISKESIDAVIFDLDGVITKTAKVHAAAWKNFDHLLRQRAGNAKNSNPLMRRIIGGMWTASCVTGIKLWSRGFLPYGVGDDPDRETVCGLGNKKNKFFHEHLKKDGVEVYEHAPDFLRKLRQNGFKTAIVSSSKNCTAVLETAGLLRQFDAQVDGMESEKFGLKGKPDRHLSEAARRLGVEPKRAIVLEDAIAE
jgi:alpha,alpha-trehalase